MVDFLQQQLQLVVVVNNRTELLGNGKCHYSCVLMLTESTLLESGGTLSVRRD